jgi:hypothetical protein
MRFSPTAAGVKVAGFIDESAAGSRCECHAELWHGLASEDVQVWVLPLLVVDVSSMVTCPSCNSMMPPFIFAHISSPPLVIKSNGQLDHQ